MAPPLIHLKGLRLRIGATQLFEDAELAVASGDRIGLVGLNGSGKSTLLKIAAINRSQRCLCETDDSTSCRGNGGNRVFKCNRSPWGNR